MNTISLQVVQQYHTNNNINKAKKRTPLATGLGRECLAKISEVLTGYFLSLLVTENLVP